LSLNDHRIAVFEIKLTRPARTVCHDIVTPVNKKSENRATLLEFLHPLFRFVCSITHR